MKTTLTFSVFLILTHSALATTHFVAADGSGDFPTIQAAVDASAPGDIIELGNGVFLGNGNRDVDLRAIELTIRSQSGDPALCIIDCQGSFASPHRGFLLGSTQALESQLLGVTVRNGDVRSDNSALIGRGGAVYCGPGSPRLENCIFANNLAQLGGAVELDDSASPVITGCSFISNQANYNGGGLRGTTTGTATVANCVFSGNNAANGGGLHVRGLSMSGSTIAGNAATGLGGGAVLGEADLTGCTFEGNHARRGGALSMSAPSQNSSFADCEFLDNSADETGGALDSHDNELHLSSTFTDCRFEENLAPAGGAAHVSGVSCAAVFDHCWFSDNEATVGGALSSLEGAVLNLAFCTLAANEANWGGALYGGRISLGLAGCTLYGNASAIEGGALYLTPLQGAIYDFQNTIIAFSTAGAAIATDGTGDVTMSCCDVYGNAGGDWVGVIAPFYGNDGNIALDPQFCDAPAGNFELAATSPCAPFTEPNPECDLIGAHPVGCGGTPAISTSWGGIKDLYH